MGQEVLRDDQERLSSGVKKARHERGLLAKQGLDGVRVAVAQRYENYLAGRRNE